MSNEPHILASSARAWSECKRKVWLDYNPPAGMIAVEDPFGSLMAERGVAHEAEVKARFPDAVTARSAEHTQELIQMGVPVIYQPVLIDAKIGIEGRPDFLILTERGTYQVADAKSALSLKDHDAVQVAVYKKLLGTAEPGIVFLGDGRSLPVDAKFDLKREEFLASMRELLSSPTSPDATFGETRCSECQFDALCRPKFIADGELTLVYGLDSRMAKSLKSFGVKTVRDLAATAAESIPDLPYVKGIERKRALVLQARSYLTGEIFQIAPLNLPSGTWVHFDVENNPFAPARETYLWGLLPPPHLKESFRYAWSDGTPAGDKFAWRDFVATLADLRATYPDLRLVHYSSFEKTQLKGYAARYGMEADPTVQWLLGKESPLYDLRATVSNSLILPVTGYGLKAICKNPDLVNFQWELKESGSQWSVVRYLDYLKERDPAERERVKAEILSYNRDDVRATRALEVWLRARAEAAA